MLINFKKNALPLVLIALSLGACRKKQALNKAGEVSSSFYQIRISANDEKTARVWRDTVGMTENGGWKFGKTEEDKAHLGGALVKNNQSITYVGSSLQESEIIERLTSKEDSNRNDAIIKNLQIRFIDKNGKEVVLAKREEMQVGADFFKTFEIPDNVDFIIEARGEQTGKTISKPQYNWWARLEKKQITQAEFNNLANANSSPPSNTQDQNQIGQYFQNQFIRYSSFIHLGVKIGSLEEIAKSYAGLTAQAFAIEGTGRRLTDARVSLKILVLKGKEVVVSQSVSQSKAVKLTVKGRTK